MARRRKRPHPEGDVGVAIGYARVSKDEQQLGPEGQRESLRR
jgi:hypothetical protein